MIWNETKLIDLDCSGDDYGNVPDEFKIDEFPSTHYFTGINQYVGLKT